MIPYDERRPATVPELPENCTSLDVLAVSAHPDDAEIGMGGAIVRFLGQGLRVGILDLTSGEPTPRGNLALRRAETLAANQAMGNPWRGNLGLPNRSLEPDLPSRRALAAVFRRVRPQMVFTHYWDDAHPDHVAACKLVEDARFWSKLSKSDLPGEPFHPKRIFHFFSIHLRMPEQPSFLLDITAEFPAKLRALNAYASQLPDPRAPADPHSPPSGVIAGVAEKNRYWGRLIGVDYAEPFAAKEPIGLTSLSSFVI